MSPFAAVAFYPLWAIALVVGFVALRMTRRSGFGLVLLSFTFAAWVGALVLLESRSATWAERLLPAGMLQAGAFVHAADGLSRRRHRGVVVGAWLASMAITLLGLVAPRLLYGPGATTPGPLFFPLAALSVVGSVSANAWLLVLARGAQPGVERRQRVALLVANLAGALGGGGAITLHITGLAPTGVAAPFLLIAIVGAAYAVWSGEDVRGRELISQGVVVAVLTAIVGTPVIVALMVYGSRLIPGGSPISLWGVLVILLALLPSDPFRELIAEQVVRALFARPIAVGALADEIEHHERRADHAERLAELGLVASAVAHEVRNPLGVILAEAKLLEREGASAESVEAIRAQVRRASRFVDELLRYSKPRPLELREVDVAEALRSVIASVGKAHDAPRRIRAELEGGVRIEADRDALVDVATQLLVNAVIATSAAGGEVRVRLAIEGDHMTFVVEDDGPGVPTELVPRLFEPFVTGRGRDAEHPGTGLGLAMARRLAERHGARILHERPEQGGARFVVRWPRTASGVA